jgi:choline dehydrogenase-like flavoprotein
LAISEPFDVCVIGTGAGGGAMLDPLTPAVFRFVALERGPHRVADHFARQARSHSP